MIFNELTYFLLFLLPAVLLFHAASARFRPWVLSAFGAAFFVYFGYLHFGGLWGAVCVLLFVWEMATSRLYRPRSRWCLFGIVQAIVLLLVFKYLTFAVTTWNELAHVLRLPPLTGAPRLLLPLGISFFTFEFIHFAADSYAGKLVTAAPKPPPSSDQPAGRPPTAQGESVSLTDARGRASAAEYSAFILFFPSMVAGPIKRYQEFVPKLRAARFNPTLAAQGVTRILAGLVKKHLFADTFALFAVKLTGLELYTATPLQIAGWIAAYGMQIYLDFSAYSDIAIGSGYLFGIVIPENFNWPYASRNISEFWRRWHISLSRWIRDYVYIPLGGSRRGGARTALNLLLAFTISGIWHGAANHFAAWGAWHGLLLIGHREWQRRCPKLSARIPDAVSIALTFVAVNLGWTLFFLETSRAMYAVARMLRIA